jgi:2-(1,2-epoxy-1,2-dihydrophenyl)acetyl-CoA isomerase
VPLGLPGEADYIATYCPAPGAHNSHWDFYIAFQFFRLAAIFHGIKGRVLRGTANARAARAEAFPAWHAGARRHGGLHMPNPVLLHRDGGVAVMTLNRPEAGNTVDMDLARLEQAARDCAADPAVRCVVLTGAGKLFCAAAISPLRARRIASAFCSIWRARCIARCWCWCMDKPVVTLVNGPAAGAGLSLALLGDVVLAGLGPFPPPILHRPDARWRDELAAAAALRAAGDHPDQPPHRRAGGAAGLGHARGPDADLGGRAGDGGTAGRRADARWAPPRCCRTVRARSCRASGGGGGPIAAAGSGAEGGRRAAFVERRKPDFTRAS